MCSSASRVPPRLLAPARAPTSSCAAVPCYRASSAARASTTSDHAATPCRHPFTPCVRVTCPLHLCPPGAGVRDGAQRLCTLTRRLSAQRPSQGKGSTRATQPQPHTPHRAGHQGLEGLQTHPRDALPPARLTGHATHGTPHTTRDTGHTTHDTGKRIHGEQHAQRERAPRPWKPLKCTSPRATRRSKTAQTPPATCRAHPTPQNQLPLESNMRAHCQHRSCHMPGAVPCVLPLLLPPPGG